MFMKELCGTEVEVLDDDDAEKMANWLVDRVVDVLLRDPRLPQLQIAGWNELLEGVRDEATAELMKLVSGKIDFWQAELAAPGTEAA